jgi:RNA polymerase subunit RPABC4/transcription elongation factor Spt4
MPKCTGPVLILVLLLFIFNSSPSQSFAQQVDIYKTHSLAPTDDAYVVSDLNDVEDIPGLRKLNTGDLPFLKIWYAWNVTADNTKILSFAYLHFDLSGLNKEQAASAKLRMYAQNVSLSADSRPVDLHLASIQPWEENTIRFVDAPTFKANLVDTATITTPGWYEWNITEAVRENAGSNMTLAVILQQLVDNNEELVIFASKDTLNDSFRPALEVELVPSSAASLPVVDTSNSMLTLGIILAIVSAGTVAGYTVYRKKGSKEQTVPEPISGRLSTNIPTQRTCPNCGKNLREDFKICPYCEYDLMQIKCRDCKRQILKEYTACPYCGSKVSR